MMRIVVTGGMGSGKSMVTAAMRKMLPHYHIYDYDVAVHSQYFHAEVKAFLTELCGTHVRNEVSTIVHADPDKKERLIDFMRPRLSAEFLALSVSPNVVFDVPLFFEMQDRGDPVPAVDYIICVTAPMPLRMERIRTRDHKSDKQIQRILDTQLPDSEKIRRSSAVIINDGTVDQLYLKVTQLLTDLRVV